MKAERRESLCSETYANASPLLGLDNKIIRDLRE